MIVKNTNNSQVKNIKFYLIIVIIIFYINFISKDFNIVGLGFLLKPTNYLIENITNSIAEFNIETGYFHSKLNIIINQSCSGINFWLLSFVVASVVMLNKISSNIKKVLGIFLALFFSYLVTIFANTSRIIISIKAQDFANNFLPTRPHLYIHSLVGTILNIVFLILIYYSIIIFFKFYNNEKLI